MNASGSVPAGTRVGRYEIVSLLRQGGMGEVYAAEDRNLGRRVALKILPPHRTSDPARVARFVREARASSTLNHPAIVSVHDAGNDGDVHFLAMELIDGAPLSEWMRKRRGIGSRLEVMAQVADGLAKAHDAGIVHRDLKPDNIMVTRDGRAKIVDFGVAKLTERGVDTGVTGVTTPTSRVGTTAYMSPEQIEGKRVDHRADVFAFGVVLYEVLAGRNPFAAAQYADTVHNIVHLEPPFEAIPRAVRRIVRRCLAKDPELRYHSMRDVALDLRDAVDEPEVALPGRSRRGAIALAILLVLFGAVLWVKTRPDGPAEPRGMTMIRLTNSGRVTSAAISPDGKYLAHSIEEAGGEALYVKQIATGVVTRIAEAAPMNIFEIAVSPDSTYVYYLAARLSEPNVAYIEQVPLLGGQPRRIADDTEFAFGLSPDATRVVFIRFDSLVRESRLVVAPVDGSAEKVLLTRKLPERIAMPAWSPTGESLTFVLGSRRAAEGQPALHRLTLATGDLRKIETPDFPSVGSYAWLPDGSGSLLTVYGRDEPPQVWYVPAGDTAGRKITSEVSGYFDIRSTQDSRSFSAVRDVTEGNIYTLDLQGDGSSVRALTSGVGNIFGGAVLWLDARTVLFSAVANGASTYLAVDPNGGAPRRLIHNMRPFDITASPDRSRIAFISDHGGSLQVWVADASGANARQVTKAADRPGWPSFTADGRSIVYLLTGESQFAWRVPIDGSSPPVQVTNVPTSRPAVSPDGKWLLCRLRSQQANANTPLWRTAIIPLDGKGAPRYFAGAPAHGGPPELRWHPDGRSFLYLDYKDGVANVWLQPLDGSAPRQLTPFKSGRIFSFDIAPDGSKLVLGRGEWSRDAVLIRDFR